MKELNCIVIMNLVMHMIKKTKIIKASVALAMLIFIIGSAIIIKQPPYMTLPLTISVFIMLLQTEVNRFAFLMGGLNSVIYATVDFKMGVYASGWYGLLFSFPLQIISFINWNRRKYKNSTVLNSLSKKARIIIALAFAVCWAAIFVILYIKDNPYAILDSTSSLLGILVTFLSMFAYREYPYINILGGVISIFLNTQICINDINRVPYLIFSAYSMICIVVTAVNINKLYKEQRSKQL